MKNWQALALGVALGAALGYALANNYLPHCYYGAKVWPPIVPHPALL